MRNWRVFLLWFTRLGIAAGVLYWLHASGSISWPLLSGLLVAWPITLLAFVVFAIDSVITAARLCLLLRPTGARLSLYDSSRLTFMGMFFTICLPGGTGGDAVRIYYASIGNQGSRAELATVILFDRVVGLFAMFLWPVMAAPFFPRLLGNSPVIRNLIFAAAIAALTMLCGMILMLSPRVRRNGLVVWAFRRLPLGGLLERIVDTLHGYRHDLSALLSAIGISLVAHTLAVGVALLISLAIDPGGFSWEIAVLVPLGFMANAFPFTPGGLGVGEAAFDALFRMAGLRGGSAVMLGWRLVMLLTSLIGAVFYLQGKKQMIHLPRALAYKEESTYDSVG
jgi:glycosyltransferase 2 family protein